MNGLPPPQNSGIYPASSAVNINQDAKSRYVTYTVAWSSALGGANFLAARSFGMEFKTHQHNYDVSASVGKGPAYVVGPGAVGFTDLPGGYVDSDYASDKNSMGEYREPQVAWGVAPGAATLIQSDRSYVSWRRAISGRGDKSLTKVHEYVTRDVAFGAMGLSGYFHCRDIPVNRVVSFEDGVYSPTCIMRSVNGPLVSCNAPTICTEFNRAGSGGGQQVYSHRFGALDGLIAYQLQAYAEPNALKVIRPYYAGPAIIDIPSAGGLRDGTGSYSGRDESMLVVVDGISASDRWDVVLSCPNKPPVRKILSAGSPPPPSPQESAFSLDTVANSGFNWTYTFRNINSTSTAITNRVIEYGNATDAQANIQGGTCSTLSSLASGASCTAVVSATQGCTPYTFRMKMSNPHGYTISWPVTISQHGNPCS